MRRKVELDRNEDGRVEMPGADLHGADLYKANLYDAKLAGADLVVAELRGANLHLVDLQGANLYNAKLARADLREADLRGAYLRGADLRGADLRDAGLEGANLRGADLRGADLRWADLRGADLEEAIGVDEVPRAPFPSLAARVLEQITGHPESLDMDYWHSECGTKHCFAGWAVALAGEVGKASEGRLGTGSAARLLLGGSDHPFNEEDGDKVIPWLEARVREEGSDA